MKFNRPSEVKNRIVNLAGGEAFKESPELELISLLLTSFVEDKFYEKASTQLDRLELLVKANKDKQFVAKAGIYARTQFGMRSITHALVAELAHEVKGTEWLKNAISKTIYRPDDMMEVLSYYGQKYGKPIPNSLKKGLAKAFDKFDAYQLAKYRGEGKEMKLVDVVNLVHPIPIDKNREALSLLVKGELKSVDTWETKLTQAGQAVADIKDETEKSEKLAELKKGSWKKLIQTKKIGYFALLKNLRNLLEQAPEMIDEACALLTHIDSIKKSLVLPFRFSTALKEIESMTGQNTRKVVDAIHKALDLSLSNVPVFEGRTLVVLDESGSMSGKPGEIGSLFAAVIYKTNDADLMTFSNDARYRNLHSGDSTLTISKRLMADFAAGGTNFHAIFQTAKEKYDRIIILSDMQGWIGDNAPTKTFADYKKRTGANPKIYSFDLNGYGSLQFPEQGIYCLAGFSDKVLDLMKVLEEDRQALINKIKKTEI